MINISCKNSVAYYASEFLFIDNMYEIVNWDEDSDVGSQVLKSVYMGWLNELVVQ